ncbi:PAS and ANTAR domain-containing protein [Mycobacterium sp. NPDC051804]|uniref:PAS and ANTAR domain-containing protein n=1 Tax=Mycobacterium sp. NPDC051804 TaxID=3364295 RepID=UPI0037A913F9
MRAPGDGRDRDPVRKRFTRTPAGLGATETRVNGAGAVSGVGSFWFWFDDPRWEWSDEVYRMHGYAPRSIAVTTELVSSHQHPEDRDGLQELLDRVRNSGESHSVWHRFCDTTGREHIVIVVVDPVLDSNGVLGARGHYIDVTTALKETSRDILDETLPKLVEARAAIEQAKGALRLVYGMNDEQAFKLLQWRSQENNTKLRALATQLVSELDALTSATSALRTEFDHLIMTVHERVNGDS